MNLIISSPRRRNIAEIERIQRPVSPAQIALTIRWGAPWLRLREELFKSSRASAIMIANGRSEAGQCPRLAADNCFLASARARVLISSSFERKARSVSAHIDPAAPTSA
jgi:hypothetical protein